MILSNQDEQKVRPAWPNLPDLPSENSAKMLSVRAQIGFDHHGAFAVQPFPEGNGIDPKTAATGAEQSNLWMGVQNTWAFVSAATGTYSGEKLLNASKKIEQAEKKVLVTQTDSDSSLCLKRPDGSRLDLRTQQDLQPLEWWLVGSVANVYLFW